MNVGAPTIAAVGFDRIADKLRCRRSPARTDPGPLGDGEGRRPARAGPRARAPPANPCDPVPRPDGPPARRLLGDGAPARSQGEGQRHKTIRVARPAARGDEDPPPGGPRPRDHGQRVAGHAGRGRAGRAAVQVLTAADNGRHNYHVAATVITAANGGWSARVGPGPSRLIRAYYPGAAGTEPAESAPVTLSVPAKIELLRVTPRRVAWGDTVRIVGRLAAGYFPPGGALVRLRIGEGSAASPTACASTSAATTAAYHHLHVRGRRRRQCIAPSGLNWRRCPWATTPTRPADSNRPTVLVGGHPSQPPHKPRHRHHGTRRR